MQVDVYVNLAGEVSYGEQGSEVRLEATGKAEIMECRCYVCTEQTTALYTGNCTLIYIIQTQHEKEGGRKIKKKNKMRQEKARGKGTEVFFQVILVSDEICPDLQ